MYQTLDTLLDFDECAVVGEVGDLAEQAGTLRVTTRQAGPRIVAQLLDAQRYTVLFLIVLQHFGGDFLTNRQHLGRVTHATPCEIGDVQQTIDTTQIHERAVVGDVLHDAIDDGALFQGLHQLGALFAHRCLDHSATRQHDVVTLTIKLDHLELEGLALVWGGVFDRTCINQRAWQEGTDAIREHSKAAFDLAADGTSHQFAGLHRFLKREPGRESLGLVTREDGVAETIFE